MGEKKVFKDTVIKIPVTFEFNVTGELGEVMRSIHEQIMTDLNDYNQFPDDKAQLHRIIIHEWKK